MNKSIEEQASEIADNASVALGTVPSIYHNAVRDRCYAAAKAALQMKQGEVDDMKGCADDWVKQAEKSWVEIASLQEENQQLRDRVKELEQALKSEGGGE